MMIALYNLTAVIGLILPWPSPAALQIEDIIPLSFRHAVLVRSTVLLVDENRAPQCPFIIGARNMYLIKESA